MDCKFTKPDGSWNIAEGPDEQGQMRVQCTQCGRLYPSAGRPLIRIRNPHGKHCGQRRVSMQGQEGDSAQATCLENALLRAQRAYEALVDSLANAHGKGHEAIQAAIFEESVKVGIIDFRRLLALALKQAIQEGKKHGTDQPPS